MMYLRAIADYIHVCFDSIRTNFKFWSTQNIKLGYKLNLARVAGNRVHHNKGNDEVVYTCRQTSSLPTWRHQQLY